MATMFGKEKRQKAPEQAGGFRGAAGPAALKPKLGLTVTDPNPTVASVLSFERAAIKDTIFTFTASEAAIVNVKNKSFKGFTAKAVRKDGRFTSEALHSFASGDTRVSVAATEKRSERVFTAKYIASLKKPTAGVAEATVKSGANKITASVGLMAKNLSSLTWTNETLRESRAEGQLPATVTLAASVNTNKVAKLGIKKKVGDDTYSVDYIFPFVASASWKHNAITVSASAPLTTSGLGETRLMVAYEPVYRI